MLLEEFLAKIRNQKTDNCNRWWCRQNHKRRPVLRSNLMRGLVLRPPGMDVSVCTHTAAGTEQWLSPWRHCQSYLRTPDVGAGASATKIIPLLLVPDSRSKSGTFDCLCLDQKSEHWLPQRLERDALGFLAFTVEDRLLLTPMFREFLKHRREKRYIRQRRKTQMPSS